MRIVAELSSRFTSLMRISENNDLLIMEDLYSTRYIWIYLFLPEFLNDSKILKVALLWYV